MNMTSSILRLALAGAVLAGPALRADDSPFSFDLKLHAGLMGGALQTAAGDNKTFGLGLEGAYALGGRRAITVELGYDVFGARWRDVTPQSGPVWLDPNTAIAETSGAAPTTTWHEAPLTLSSQSSIDLRKESIQGFSLRLGFRDALPWAAGMTWKAGLSLDGYKVQSEFTGTLIPVDGNPQGDATDIDPNYYEGWTFTRMKTKVGLGAFAGVGFEVMKDLRLELNLRSVTTGHCDYHPFTYTGRPAYLEEATRHSVAFEIALALSL